MRGLEQKLLNASAERIHEFERRLEHEWLALRQLHEEPLKTLEQRTTAITENCLNVVREALILARERIPAQPAVIAREEPDERHALATIWQSRAPIILLIAALAALAALAIHTRWQLGSDVRETAARAAASEGRVVRLQELVERNTRENQQTVQRLTADALASAARAERLANVLAASDLRLYPLRGLQIAAGADGQVFFSPARGIALTASKVPAQPADHVYQLWLTTTRGPISLGLVSPDGQGRIGVAFDSPSDLLGTAIGFMLSVEPVGGNPKPTGPIALAS